KIKQTITDWGENVFATSPAEFGKFLAAEKTVLLAKPMNGINAPQRPDCVADDAVSCELVSAANSLLTGKLTGNFAESEPSATILTFNQRANSKACRQIPYTTEQGNFAAITGNFFGITGNLIERAGKALSCCRTSN